MAHIHEATRASLRCCREGLTAGFRVWGLVSLLKRNIRKKGYP